MKRKATSEFAMASVVMTILATCTAMTLGSGEASALTDHAPITINGNGGFLASNATTGVTWGSGTLTDPYTIEGWKITGTWEGGIYISNTDVHFIIRNVSVNGVPMWSTGIQFQNVENGTVRDTVIDLGYYGMQLSQVSNCSLINVSVANCDMAACDIRTTNSLSIISARVDNCGDSIFMVRSNYSLIRDSLVTNGWMGIYLNNSNNCTIDGNNISSCLFPIRHEGGADSVISNNSVRDSDSSIAFGGRRIQVKDNDIDNTTWGIGANNARQCIVSGNRITATKADGMGQWSDIANITIERNVLRDISAKGIWLSGCDNLTVASNDIMNTSIYSIHIEDCNHLWILNNIITNGSTGIQTESCDFVEIKDNRVSECDSGISAMGGKDIEISQNDVSASGYASLQISQYDNVTIDNNTAEDGDYYGLTIGMCNDTIISGNRILNNGDDGIRIDNGNRTTCSGNVVFGNNYIGFEIVLTGNCTIVENVISENAVAAFVWMSDNVTVHHNYIFGLAWDLDSKNISWDNGYPLGGNYWTVYTGTDLFSGPNQDIPGGDGMGDTPYAVDADSQDHYPLMNSPMADHDPPFTSFEWSGGSRTNGWNTSPIMVWLNASDSGIGVASTYFRLGGPVGLWDEYTGPFTVSWNCNTTLEYRSVDYLINQEITRSATIRVDISPPYTIRAINCTDGEHGWCRSAATMELIGIDSGSGINWTKCSIDGNSWNEYNSPFILSSEGKHLVEFYSQDNAGHTEDVGNCSIWIDTLAPNLEIAVDNGTVFQQGAVYISWNASDVTSGIDARYHWYLTSPGYNYDLITNTTTLNLSAYAAGRYNLTIQAFDMAGNVAERTISFEISSSMTSNSFDLTWVIVILTIGILVGISVPKIFGMRKKAKESDVRAAVKDTAAGKAQLYDDYKPKEPGPPGDAKQK